MSLVRVLLLSSLVLSAKAFATTGVTWAGTLGDGKQTVTGVAGFPSVGAMYLRGLGNDLDVGATLSFDYAVPALLLIRPGVQAGFLAKLALIEGPKLNLVLHLPLTFHLHFAAAMLFGIGLPLQAIAGVPLTEKLTLHAGVELAPRLWVTPVVRFAFSAMPLGGVELELTDGLSLGGTVKAGLGVNPGLPGTVGFVFGASAFAAYRL